MAVSMHTTYFKLHIGIVVMKLRVQLSGEGATCVNISAVRESNEKKTSMEVATFLKKLVGEGECWSTGTRQRTIFIVTIIDATPVNDDVCVNCVVPT